VTSASRSPNRQAKPPLDLRLGTFFVRLLVLGVPFVLAPVAKESFREPKLLAGEGLALASLTCFAWGLRRVETVRLADLWRLPALRLIVPCLLVATAGLAFSHHPLQVRDGLADLWIGAAALVGWSAALPGQRAERLLRGLLWPASLLALVGVLQYFGFQPLALAASQRGGRLAITSLAGNPGDLAAYLVLPCLVAQLSLGRRLRAGEDWASPRVWGTALALAVSLYAMLLTQTLAAVAAVLLGTLLLWAPRLPRRRAAALAAGLLVALALLAAGVAPLRHRVMEKAQALAEGNWNWLLTGRLDGWRTAAWMLREHPLTGVGQGAYRAEFAPAKLALLEQGVKFFPGLKEVGFANAHNEILEAGAEWGIPGLLALAWALWVLLAALSRAGRAGRSPEDRALAWAGTAALGVLSLVDFPFRIALAAFPALLFLSWVLGSGEPGTSGEVAA
jgi:O-antigen ligase